MIKSKLISILVSTGLTIALGVGGFFVSSKNENVNDTTKVQSNSETSSENKESKAKKPNALENTTNTNVDSKDKVSSESNTESNVNSNTDANNTANNNATVAQENNTNNNSDECYNNNGGNSQGQINKPSQGTNNGQGSNPAPEKPPVSENSNYIAEIEQAIFQRVNQERAAAGLPALSYNTTMEHYARVKSKDMGDRGYFDHKDPQGKLITDQMRADGVSYNAWGENIAYIQGMNNNSALATKFMDNWMNSPGHRANILSSNFSSIGIGVYKIGNTYYATQEFYR